MNMCMSGSAANAQVILAHISIIFLPTAIMIVLKKSCFADIGSESITGGFMEYTSMTEEEVAVSRAIIRAFKSWDDPFIPIDIEDEDVYECIFTHNREHISDWVMKMTMDKDIPYVLLGMIQRYFMDEPDESVNNDIFGYIIDQYFNSFTDKMLLLTTFYGLFIIGSNDDVLAEYRSNNVLKWFAKELVRKILPWIHSDGELFKLFSMRYVRVSLDEAVADHIEKRVKDVFIEREHWEEFEDDDYDQFDYVLHQTILHVLCTEEHPEETLAKFFNENTRVILAKGIDSRTLRYIPGMITIKVSKMIKNKSLCLTLTNGRIFFSSDEEYDAW